VELSFNYSFEDYVEASRAVRKFMSGPRTRPRESMWVCIIGGVVAFALLVLIGLSPARTGDGHTQETTMSAFWSRAIAWVVPVTVAWALLARTLEQMDRWAMRRAMVFVLVFGLLCCALAARRGPAPPTPPSDSVLSDLIIGLGPWLASLCALLIILRLIVRSSYRKGWNGTPHMRLPHVARFTDDSVYFENEQWQETYRWRAFIHFIETENLFILQPSRFTFHMIPKRACRDATEVESLRQFMERHVPSADPKAIGFAVVQR
jgi:hypothetical protein